MKTDNNEIVIEGLGKGVINYGMVLMLHLDRTGKALCSSMQLDTNAADTAFNSIRALDSLLTPYKDDTYIQAKKEIMAKSEPKDRVVTLDEYYQWFGLLVTQLGKAGLLPAETNVGIDSYEFDME